MQAQNEHWNYVLVPAREDLPRLDVSTSMQAEALGRTVHARVTWKRTHFLPFFF